MKSKRNVLAVLLACGLAAGSAVQAREFSNLYIFGDSLSDSGTFAAAIAAPLAFAKFTTNADNVWGQNLAARYGTTISPAYSTAGFVYTANGTGNNFAIGGARADLQPGVLGGALAPMQAALPPVSAQVTSFLSRGAVDPNALYAVWAGANDVFTQLGAVGAGLPIPTALANLQTAATAEVTQIARLRAAGARNLIVVGLPNIGATPFGTASGPATAGLLGTMSSTYNDTLKSALAGGNVLYFDGAAALNAVIANPARFGISNTTNEACGVGTSSLGCVPGLTPGAVSAVQAAGYAFADSVHPSGALHRIVADWIYSTLESTGRLSLLSTVPMGRSGAQWRSIDGRMREFQNFSHAGHGFFVTGDYAPSRLDATANSPSASGAGSSVTLGFEKSLSDSLFGGLALGYARTPFDLGNNSGKVKYDEWALSAFVSKKLGSFYANAIGTAASLNFATSRNTILGATTNTDTGETDGRQLGLKFQVGYNYSDGSYVHGPLAGVAWEEVTVKAYQENSGNFTAMQFGEQRRKQLRSRLGYQIQGMTDLSGMRFRPYAQLTHEYQHLKDNRDYTAAFVGSTAAMGVATENRKGGYGLLSVGGTVDISKTLNLGIGATTTLSQPGARNSSFSVTLGLPL